MTTEMALFSADGQIGRGMKGPAEFETCSDLLAFMDRLGVSRALAWNIEARDGPAMKGNRRLLAEIDSLGPRARRLVPSFVVAPSMLRDPKAMDELGAHLSAGRVKALRVAPRTLSHKMRHVEPLIRQVAKFNPAVLVDVRELADDADLLAFAEALPQTPVVCLHAMWPQFFGVFNLLDLLRRRPNILVGTAWMHMHGIIERVAKEFGPQRLVFSTGTPCHNAAAIGALAYAQVSPEVRDGIAHGNLDRLLGLPPTPPLRTPAINSLWERFLQGKATGVDIIDAHGHLSPPEPAGWHGHLAHESQGRPAPAAVSSLSASSKTRKEETTHGRDGHATLSGAEGDLDEAVRTMDRVGIRTLIATAGQALHGEPVDGNRAFAQAGAAYGDRLRGWVGFNPYYSDALAGELDDLFSRPFFVGIKFLCYYWGVPVTDARFRPAYEYAQRHRLPILLHTWDDPFDTPALLKDIAPRYPDAAFLLGHSGGGNAGRLEAHELAAANPNVYLEFCGSFCSNIPWETTLKVADPKRVVFGTDAMGHDMAWELARFLSLNVPQETLVPILGDNMRRLLSHSDVKGADAFRPRA